MKYYFEVEKEINACIRCPLLSRDNYGASGCNLLNDYLNCNEVTNIDTRCLLKQVEEDKHTTIINLW